MSLIDFDSFIAERTHDFTGREWVFQAINDWLADDGGLPVFLLSGGPGSGKSALAAQVAHMSLGKAPADDYSRLGPGGVTFYHFCQALRDRTLNPLRFVESLSQTLADRYQPFAQALTQLGDQNININVEQTAGVVEGGGQIAGVVIEELHISNLSARVAFDRLVRGPLEQLYTSGFDELIIILVDSLDEALTYDEENNIVSLLGHATELPRNVRFLLTSRPDDRVQNALGDRSLDLIDDAPTDSDDVLRYVTHRLNDLPESRRTELAQRVAEAANGNFLYTRYVLDDLLPQINQIADLSGLPLPKDLQDHYRQFLKRELGRNLKEWKKDYRPVLGIIAVAQGQGLTRAQIAGVTGRQVSETGDILDACDQYLAGPQPDGPFRIYHQSFRDFLLEEKSYQVYPAEANQAAAEYLLKEYKDKWLTSEDTYEDVYALSHTLTHLAQALHLSKTGQPQVREALIESLIELLTDFGFLEAKIGGLGIDALLLDLQTALNLDAEHLNNVQTVLRILDRESDNLRRWDRAKHPAYFAQQFHNYAVEMQLNDLATAAATRLKQIGQPYLALHAHISGESRALVRILSGMPGGARITVTADSQYALSGCFDQTFRVWDIETGRVVRTLTGQWEPIGFTADDSQALLSSSGSLAFWDLHNGKVTRVIQGRDEWVRALAVIPQGSSVICATQNHNLIRVDLETGKVVQEFSGPAREVDRMVMTPDGRYAITATVPGSSSNPNEESSGNYQSLQMWDLELGRDIPNVPLGMVMAEDLVLHDMAVTPDGQRFIAVINNRGSGFRGVKIWDVQTWQELYSLEVDEYMQAIAVTPDSRYVIVSCREEPGNLTIWDLRFGQPVAAFVGNSYPIPNIAVTPNGRYLISAASANEGWRVWDLRSILAEGGDKSLPSQIGPVWLRAMTPDGRFVILAGLDNMLRVWDLQANKELHTLGQQEGIVRAVAVTSDSRYAVSTADGATPRVWDLHTGQQVHILVSDDRFAQALAVTLDDHYIISVSGDKTLRVWDLLTGQVVGKPNSTTDDMVATCRALTITPNGHRVVSATNDVITIWDFETHQVVHRIPHQAYSPILTVTPNGLYVFSASDDGTIGVWDLERGAAVHQLTGHNDWVRAIAVTADGRYAISASNDATVKVWDLHMWKEMRSLDGHKDWVYDMVLTKDDRHIFSASQDRTLRVWDRKSGEILAVATLGGILERVMVAPDGRTVVAQERTGSVYCLSSVEPND